jgi:hypothetical protein
MVMRALETSGWAVGGPYGAAVKLAPEAYYAGRTYEKAKKRAIFRPTEESIRDKPLTGNVSSNRIC